VWRLRINNAPQLDIEIADQNFVQNKSVNYQIPKETFSDKDEDELVITVDPTE